MTTDAHPPRAAARPARGTPPGGPLPDVALRPLLLASLAVAAVLVALAGRYGYHRDELYFLAAGRHLAWGYVDQPPLTPLLARAVSEVAGDSLVALRTPSALAAAGVVLLTGLLARELGGGRAAQLLAAASMAVSSILLVVGHLLSTSTLDLLVWTTLTLLVLRALRTGDGRWWLAVGVVAGVGLQNKHLPLALLAGVGVGVLLGGPRRVLLSPWPWCGAALALLLWAPNLVWQAANGWPQLALAGAIAGGASGTSEPRWAFLPFQLVLVSPALAPVWIAGLVRLLRDPSLRWARCLGWAYPVLAGVFLLTGGKPYYLAGLYPVLLAAGAPAAVAWARRRGLGRRTAVEVVGISGVLSAVLMLPVLPVTWLHRTPVVDVNYDAGETVGWPAFVRTLATAHAALPAEERADAVVLTGNYGEAGAVDRFGPALGLPPARSGHNAYWSWGPPEGTGTVLAVGLPEERLRELFASVEAVAQVDNGVALDNDEQGRTVWVCRGLRGSWADVWPELRRVG